MTGREIVSAALRLIGAVSTGETPPAQEANDGISALNRMLSSWSTENMMVNAVTREAFTLTATVSSYTMGAGATFNSARPESIERATILVNTVTPSIEYPLSILTADEWSEVKAKALQSQIPLYLYPEGTYPNETLNLYPTPSTAYQIVLYSKKPLSSISTLDTAVSLPPGYEDAIVYNLAMRLSPEYGRAVTPEIAQIASESKAAVKRVNSKPRFLKADPALLSHQRFNIYKGDSSR